MMKNSRWSIADLEVAGRHIANCYLSNSFPSSSFKFFENRRDYKDVHRTGTYCNNGLKLFFKLVEDSNRVDEEFIVKMLNNEFQIATKLFEMPLADKILILYEYIDTMNINAYNYLRSSAYSYDEKKRTTFSFFSKLFNYLDDHLKLDILDGSCKSDVFFFGRLGAKSRSIDYYGNDFFLLQKDIHDILPNFSQNIAYAIDNINTIINKKQNTVLSYCHGDFHDFNFSLNGIFWDVDTFGFNSILSDFAIYYWHFYGRKEFLIAKYNPWLYVHMKNQLQMSNLLDIRRLKKEIIHIWSRNLSYCYKKLNIKCTYIKDEFLFKLFCRVFLVDNVLKFDVHDRKIIYAFFNEIVEKKDATLLDTIFTSSKDVGLIAE